MSNTSVWDRKNNMDMYMEWVIWPQRENGMWVATNYSEGKGHLAADTLDGLKQLIRDAEQD